MNPESLTSTNSRTSTNSVRRILAGTVLGLGAAVALVGPLSSTAGALPPGGFPDLDDFTVETFPPETIPPTIPPTTPPFTIPPVIADPSSPPTTVAPDPTPEPPAPTPDSEGGQNGGGQHGGAGQVPPQQQTIVVPANDQTPAFGTIDPLVVNADGAPIEVLGTSVERASGPRAEADDDSSLLPIIGASLAGAGLLLAGGLVYDRRRRTA